MLPVFFDRIRQLIGRASRSQVPNDTQRRARTPARRAWRNMVLSIVVSCSCANLARSNPGRRYRARKVRGVGKACSALYSSDLFGLEIRRHHDFQHFNIIAVRHLAMTNLGRLVNTRPGLQAHDALTFVLELDPAL